MTGWIRHFPPGQNDKTVRVNMNIDLAIFFQTVFFQESVPGKPEIPGDGLNLLLLKNPPLTQAAGPADLALESGLGSLINGF